MTKNAHAAALQPPLLKRRLSGEEPFLSGGTPLPFTIREFWAWSSSDLMSNTFRGRVAEFLVAQALGVASASRDEWSPWDLTTAEGTTVEVKSSAYIQSWAQRTLSTPSFDIAPKRFWSAETNTMDANPKRHAAVYVFSLLAHTERPTVEPLDVRQWEFFVVPTRALDQALPTQKRIQIPGLAKLGARACSFEEIPGAVLKAAARVSIQEHEDIGLTARPDLPPPERSVASSANIDQAVAPTVIRLGSYIRARLPGKNSRRSYRVVAVDADEVGLQEMWRQESNRIWIASKRVLRISAQDLGVVELVADVAPAEGSAEDL